MEKRWKKCSQFSFQPSGECSSTASLTVSHCFFLQFVGIVRGNSSTLRNIHIYIVIKDCYSSQFYITVSPKNKLYIMFPIFFGRLEKKYPGSLSVPTAKFARTDLCIYGFEKAMAAMGISGQHPFFIGKSSCVSSINGMLRVVVPP